ncbi:MAG: HlyD family efflux transporter periplasmic adaptor subunit [Chloroflexi bacterium]|nr:HlyD family efflux transporter periplasmic adaptor subunit [Chloroflexota bacterium]
MTIVQNDAPQQSPPVAVMATGKTVAADGQLSSIYPSMGLVFGGGVSGRVLTITVRPGDVVQAGDLVALLDETNLQRAVDDAQLALDRATADRVQARTQWERDVADAEQSLLEAQRALTTAQLQYTDTSLEESRTQLEYARQAEADTKKEYEDAQNIGFRIHLDPYHDAWQHAIRDRELAEMRLTDTENAHSADYLSLGTYEENVAQAERAVAALEAGIAPSYEHAVEDAERTLAQVQEDLPHARLTAPRAAIVLSVDVAPEATIGVGTPIVTLLDVEDGLLFITQKLGEQHAADVDVGQRAVVTLRAFPNESLEGTVEAVVPQNETAAADAHFTVFVRLSSTNLRLLPGLTGRVEIFAGE